MLAILTLVMRGADPITPGQISDANGIVRFDVPAHWQAAALVVLPAGY
jgi:hypothetical protein